VKWQTSIKIDEWLTQHDVLATKFDTRFSFRTSDLLVFSADAVSCVLYIKISSRVFINFHYKIHSNVPNFTKKLQIRGYLSKVKYKCQLYIPKQSEPIRKTRPEF